MEQVIYWATSSARYQWVVSLLPSLDLALSSCSVAGAVLQEGELGAAITGLCHSEHYIFHQVINISDTISYSFDQALGGALGIPRRGGY